MSAHRSLFTRLRSFAQTPRRNPVEDQLTEALAATLEAAPAAAREIVERAFEVEAPDAEPTISTQEKAGGRKRIDLEIAFGAGSRPELRVWFENKVGANAYREQGETYIRRLEELRQPWLFGWILPVGEEVQGGMPDAAKSATWQDLASWLHQWRRSQANQEAYGTRLVQEFVRHLEEQELAQTRALTEGDAEALNWHERAQQRAHELVAQARALVHGRWHEPLEHDDRPRRDPLWFWEKHRTHGPGRTNHWPDGPGYFEWHARRDSARDPAQRRGEIIFGAGVTFPTPYTPDDEDPWLDALMGRGFEYGRSDQSHCYVFRYLTLGELVGERNLGAQAEKIASFVVSSWEALEDRPFQPAA